MWIPTHALLGRSTLTACILLPQVPERLDESQTSDPVRKGLLPLPTSSHSPLAGERNWPALGAALAGARRLEQAQGTQFILPPSAWHGTWLPG